MADAPIPESELDSYLNDERFSREFEVPAGPGQPEPWRVTYSDFGYRDPANPATERVLLFCSPLFGSRLLHVAKDQLAKKHRVRIICPDKPGFGGTVDVGAGDRVNTWLKIVPALLEHLGIRHVSIASHSAGTIYALSTLLYLRHLLHPVTPYVALCAPWVHPSHSGVWMLRAAGYLPEGLFGLFSNVTSLAVNQVQPMVAFSSGLSSGLASAPSTLTSTSEEDARAVRFEERLGPKLARRMHAENVKGLNTEALLVLKKAGGEDVWGAWRDHDRLVPLLAEQEERRAQSGESVDQTSPLKIDVFFSESDVMIGTTAGPQWFDECWRLEQRGNRIDYTSRVVEKTDHDSVVQLTSGVFQQIFPKLPETGSHS